MNSKPKGELARFLSQFFPSVCIFLVASVIKFSPTPYRIIDGWATDHFSHYMSAIALTKVGFDIYKKPVNTYCKPEKTKAIAEWLERYDMPDYHSWMACQITGDPSQTILAINWSGIPRFYPMGNEVYHIPDALLYLNGLPFNKTNTFTTLKYLFVGILLSILIWHLFVVHAKTRHWYYIFLAVIPIILINILMWSVIGFYDPVAVLLLVLAFYFLFEKEQHAKALFIWSLAFFVHYRSLWYFTLPMIIVLSWIKKHGKHPKKQLRKDKYWLSASAILTSLSVYTFFLSFPYIRQMPINHELYWNKFSFFKGPTKFVLLAYVVSLGLSIRLRCWKTLAVLSSVSFFLVVTRELRSWHEVFIIPLLFIPFWESPRNRGVPLFICLCVFWLAVDNAVFKKFANGSFYYTMSSFFDLITGWL